MESKSMGLVALGESFSQHRVGRRRGRYPSELKQAAVEAVNLGSRVSDVAASCGLSPVQIHHWRSQAARVKNGAGKVLAPMRKLGVLPEVDRVRVCLPSGIVIEALPMQLDQILKILGRLS